LNDSFWSRSFVVFIIDYGQHPFGVQLSSTSLFSKPNWYKIVNREIAEPRFNTSAEAIATPALSEFASRFG
jgi:hypothetical protein